MQYHGPPQTYEIVNNKSVRENEQQVFDKVIDGVHLGRIAGPFVSKPFQNFHVSPLGRVPKKEQGQFRIIHDLSQPQGNSVNDFILDEYATVRYETFDDVVKLILEKGPGALIAKCDVADAFRIIPVHPDDYYLLGFKLLHKYYFFDKVLPMGCRVSCQVFEEFSKAIRFVVKELFNFHAITGILDDYVLVGKSGTFECMRGLKAVVKVAQFIGMPLKPSKTVYPGTNVNVYGISIDTINMTASIPQDKLQKALNLIQQLLNKSFALLLDVQKLVGLLNFMCKCIKPGRAFMRRLWNLTCVSNTTSNKHLTVVLTTASKQDLLAWRFFIAAFNGVTLLSDEIWISSSVLHLYTDACQTVGYAGVFNDQWFYGEWKEQFRTCNILLLELVPIVIALHLFGAQLKNKYIVLHTDNKALVHVLNNQSTKCSLTMALVRKLVIQVFFNEYKYSSTTYPRLSKRNSRPLVSFQGTRGKKSSAVAQRSTADNSSQITTMLSIAAALIVNSLSSSSRTVYKQSWYHFKSVCKMFHLAYRAASVSTILVYISHCSQLNISYSTVLTRISAISFVQRYRQLNDNTQSFLVRKALRGYKNMFHKQDSRRPITHTLLQQICKHVPSFVKDSYQVALFRAMFLLSFHAFLRVGEITTNAVSKHNILHDSQVRIVYTSGTISGVQITFKYFKHSKHNKFTLFVSKQNSTFCPVQALSHYLQIRPKKSGPLFIFNDQKPVSSSYFNSVLKAIITLIEGSHQGYSSHSFRIGAATHCCKNGYSKDVISTMGRWRSNAVNKYIRVSSFKVQ